MNSEVFPLTERNAIPTNAFERDKRALWLFQDQAENYGKFLYDSGITEMPLYFNSEDSIRHKKTNSQISCGCIVLEGVNRSYFGGNVRYLYYVRMVRGVSLTGEASP